MGHSSETLTCSRSGGADFCSRLLVSIVLYCCLQAAAFAQSIPGASQPEPEQELAGSRISTDQADQPRDEQIQSRLQEIFANLPGLQSVEVRVSEGIIFLEGAVKDSASLDKAQHLAERLSGAVTVINNIQRDRSLGTRLQAALASINSQFKDLAGNAPLLVLAILIVGIAWLLARWAAKAQWLYSRLSSNWFVRDLLSQAVQLAVVILGLIGALNLLDATALLGSLLGAVGIFGLAIGFATRDTVENYIASMLLSLRQPFEADDYVSIEGIEGRVLRLTPRATILMSLDGNHQRIPNAKVYKSIIINFTRNPLRRFEFDVGVDTGISLAAPRALAVKTVSELEGVQDNPPVVCLVHALGDSNVVLRVQGWINQRESDFQKVRSEAQQQVKEAFDKAGIIMPEPIYNVNLRRQKEPQPAAPPTSAATVESYPNDTEPDDAVTEQMRHERQTRPETDLLNPASKSE